jgi:hypothetical protein
MTYLESSCQELSIVICMGPIRGGGGVGVPRGGSELFGGGLQKLTGPLLGNFKYIIGILSSSPVNWHPF